MKKAIISGFLGLVIVSNIASVANAQVVSTSNTDSQSTYRTLLQTVIALLVQEVQQLEQQLATVEANQGQIGTATSTYNPSATMSQLASTTQSFVTTAPQTNNSVSNNNNVSTGIGAPDLESIQTPSTTPVVYDLSVTQNPDIQSFQYPQYVSLAKVGSFLVQNTSTVSLKLNIRARNNIKLPYFKPAVNGEGIGAPLGNGQAGQTSDFAELVIPANSSTIVDFYADLSVTPTGTYNSISDFCYDSTYTEGNGVKVGNCSYVIGQPVTVN